MFDHRSRLSFRGFAGFGTDAGFGGFGGMKDEVGTCSICGRPIVQTPGRGRGKLYCSPRCTEIASLKARLESVVDDHVLGLQHEAPLSPEKAAAASKLRGDLFRIANRMNYAGRPVAIPKAKSAKTRTGWRGLRRGEKLPGARSGARADPELDDSDGGM